MYQFLKEKIAGKRAHIAVVGLGYVGLPLAVNFAKKGFKVYGLDSDKDRVERLRKKESYILDISSAELKRVLKGGRFNPSTDFRRLAAADVILICVPTPLKRKYTPDISYILTAIRTIRKFLKKDTLVVLESTTYPGTTNELIRPELEKSGLKAGRDFYLAFSPERIDPGNKKFPLNRIPKIVGGLGAVSGELARLLYQKIIGKVHVVSSPETAEMTKLLENSFRIVNIGWINELAIMCHKFGIDIWEVIAAAKTKPFGFMPFYPGLGAGGHCIPDDPLYLYWKAKHHGVSSKFIKLSADINARMPQYAKERLAVILKKRGKTFSKASVLVAGVTYKRDVKDLRKSPALKLIELLQEAKCKVEYFDPLIPYLKIRSIDLQGVTLNKETLRRADCVVIAVDHSAVDYPSILTNASCIFDIRNVYKEKKHSKIVRF